jgi:GntR family transcriptional regulator, transcriptional repressor for pyruvate dehydrogenase complex
VAKIAGLRRQAAATTGSQREKPKQVADALRNEIIEGQLNEGDSLGTEASLLDRFGVSRPTLREALRIVEAEGLISIARGALGGVTVHRPDERVTARAVALVLQSRSVDLADVFDASAIIEPAAARSAALSRGRVAAARRLREIITEQKRAIDDVGDFTSSQIRFHSEIVTLASNRTLIIVMEMLNEVIARAIETVITQQRRDDRAGRRAVIRAHEMLADLIETGEGDVAQSHWNTHMARLRRSLLGERGSTVVDLTHHF